MKIAIVEDDVNYIKVVEKKLKEINESFQILCYTGSKEYKRDIIDGHENIDIAIMDIELDQETGIDLVMKTNQILPYCQIIYLTSYNQYVSDVYETEHTYFINKESMERYLPRAIQKAIGILHKINSEILSISWNKVEHNIKQQNIIYMERNKRVTYIYTKNIVYKTSQTLDDLNVLLNHDFSRCHESYIVNMNYISVINNNEIVLIDGHKLPISRKHIIEQKKAYNQFLTRHL